MKDIVTFVERPPGWLRWSGGILLASVALLLTVVGGMEQAWQLYPGAVLFLVCVVWWCFMARIGVMIDEYRITLVGPLWKRSVHRGDVQDVMVEADTGMNPGLVNWPVTSHRRERLTRLNMGGSVAVTFSEGSSRRYQFVLADRGAAEHLAEVLSG